MTWATPILGAIAAGVAIPLLLLLYFLKLRRREVEISSTLLWTKSVRDMQANAPFQRLRRNILLLLQLLALAAALLAVAQPEIARAAADGRRLVILIDRSASMSTIDPDAGATRLERAQERARDIIESLREPGLLSAGEGEQAMIIAFDAQAEVVQPFTSNKALLDAAIGSIEPTDAPAALEPALRLARAYAPRAAAASEQAPSAPAFAIRLLSDGLLTDRDEAARLAPGPLRTIVIGSAEAANIGVTALQAERSPDTPERVSIFVGAQGVLDEPRDVDVELTIDGVVHAIRELRLDPDEGGVASSGVVFRTERARGAVIRARLIVDDDLEADDEAWLILPPARRLSALYVAEQPTLLLDALEALTPARLAQASPSKFDRLARDGSLSTFDVVMLDGWAPDDPLPPGRFLVFSVDPNTAGIDAQPAPEDSEGASVVIDWRRDHPALEDVSFDTLIMAAPLTLEVSAGARMLAESDRGPLIAESVSGADRTIVVGFDVMETNWAWDYNFILFLSEAIDYLAQRGGAAGTSVHTGEIISLQLPAGARAARLETPEGETFPLSPASDGSVAFGPADRVGVYEITWSGPAGQGDVELADGRAGRLVAVNLLDPFESDVRLARAQEGEGADTSARAGGASEESGVAPAERRRRLWPWLLALAIGLVTLEWFVYNRLVRL